MTRFTEYTLADLPKIGEPIPEGYAEPCRFCGSSLIVLAKCSRYVSKDSLRRVPDHVHVRCADCKAGAPSVRLGPGARRRALESWALRSPSLDLSRAFRHKPLRERYSGKPFREGRKVPGIEPCSFCGSADVWLHETGVLSYRIFVDCERCAAEGPWASNKPDARILWNQAYQLEKKWVSGYRLKPVNPAQKAIDQKGAK